MGKLPFILLGAILFAIGFFVMPALLWPYEGLNVCEVLTTSGPTCSLSLVKLLDSAGPFTLAGLIVIWLGFSFRPSQSPSTRRFE